MAIPSLIEIRAFIELYRLKLGFKQVSQLKIKTVFAATLIDRTLGFQDCMYVFDRSVNRVP